MMPDSGTRADQPDTKWSWVKAAAVCLLVITFPILGRVLPWHDVAGVVSLLTIVVTLLSPAVGKVLKEISGRRVQRRIRWLSAIVDPDISVTICEYEGPRKMKRRSDAYEEVKAYLGASSALKQARHLIAETASNSAEKLELSLRNGEEVAIKIIETDGGATVWWTKFAMETRDAGVESAYRLYYQECHRQHVLDTYLPQVWHMGRDLIRDRQRMIVTNTPGHGWTSDMPFNHPKTFKTLAMDPERKEEIIADLKMFKNGRDYYANLGRPWKRGYLLHGPPGTGKSSMIAAMANFLNYDVYDIELTSVRSNTELRNLLIDTKSKSVIVIEDIDCSLDLTGARKDRDGIDDDNPYASVDAATIGQEKKASSRSQVTLSGLLNFIDGLWSACGEERIIVFTTNHIDKLDPALIRRGRMDKRIEMSYCSFKAFVFLAQLYLKVEWHQLFGAIEKLLGEVEMTPADVAEILTPKSDDDNEDDNVDSCLEDLVGELEKRRIAGAARAQPQGTTEQGPRRSPRIKELRMP